MPGVDCTLRTGGHANGAGPIAGVEETITASVAIDSLLRGKEEKIFLWMDATLQL